MFEQKDISIRDNNQPTQWGGSPAESASRLVTAVYMVTSFIKDSEPLKGHLRNKALESFSEVVSFIKDTQKGSRVAVLSLQELMSLIGTAGQAGLVSPMNRDILIAELGRFVSGLENTSRATEDGISSTVKDMLSAPLSVQKEERLIPQNRELISKGHFEKKTGIRNVLYKKPQPKIVQQKIGNGDRKEAILGILKNKGETTIKDIASNIAGCSEKTIQRDLNEMVEKGQIKKKGERRWTTYFAS